MAWPAHLTSDAPGLEGGERVGDDAMDALDVAFRRLRRGMVKPPQAQVPVPSLGRPLDIAKLFACGAVSDLAQDGAPVAVKDVAAALHLEHSTVSRLLGELAEEGLLVRAADDTDRRRTVVELTELGRHVVADGRRMSRFVMRTVLTGWADSDVTTLVDLLSRLADSAEQRLPDIMAMAQAESCRADRTT